MTTIKQKQFSMPMSLSMKLVEVHSELSDITARCDPKTIPQDMLDIEFAIAKSHVVRRHFLGDEDPPDEKKKSWDKAAPRHDIQAVTPYKKRLFGILHSADEIDSLPVSQHTKIDILGAQVRFVKYLRRFKFISAYRLYKAVIAPWFR